MNILSMTTAKSSSGYGISVRMGGDRYEGTAGDIEGVATGQAAGNAFNWHYSMQVKANGSTWLLHFDDWMYLQDANPSVQ